MSTVLFNPTNEDMSAQYIGETTIIPAGAKVKVDDRRARHILNVLGPRGMMTLDYGDEGENEKRKADLGRKRNIEFKRKQVVNFNQNNQQREVKKLEYVTPTEELIKYSEEVGVPLIQPYRPDDEKIHKLAEANKEIEALDAKLKAKDEEMTGLRDQVTQLTEQMTTFMNMMKASDLEAGQQGEKPKTGKKQKTDEEPEKVGVSEEETAAIIKQQYSGLSKTKFQDWVVKNWKLIPGYPESNQEEIKKIWKKFFKEDFPTDLK